jgi:PRTRC genetic system protein C
MATSESRTRRFMYNGMELPDPSPADGDQMSKEQVRDTWAGTYPELATAAVKGPTRDGDVDIYTFERSVGTKG